MVIHGVPDVAAITSRVNKIKKILSREWKSANDPGREEEKGVAQLMLASLQVFLTGNDPMVAFFVDIR